jgi:hypothetical protein
MIASSWQFERSDGGKPFAISDDEVAHEERQLGRRYRFGEAVAKAAGWKPLSSDANG